MKKQARTLLLLIICGAVGIALMSMLSSAGWFGGEPALQLKSSEFLSKVRSGQIQTADWQGNHIRGNLSADSDGQHQEYDAVVFDPTDPAASDFVMEMEKAGVAWSTQDPPVSSAIITILTAIGLPLMVLTLIYFLVLRPAQMSGIRYAGGVQPDVRFIDSMVLRDPAQVRAWAASLNLVPTRIAWPGPSEIRLRLSPPLLATSTISWDDFEREFEAERLALIYTNDSNPLNAIYSFVRRDQLA